MLNETEECLAWMCMQYCTKSVDCSCGDDLKEVFDHQFMSAGENAFRILGIKNGDNVNDWFEKVRLADTLEKFIKESTNEN